MTLIAVTNVDVSDEHRTMENGEERYNMCKAIEDMIADGRMEGKIEAIIELLEELGQVPQQVVEMIRSQDSIDVLSRWLKTAAKVDSIAEFEANM